MAKAEGKKKSATKAEIYQAVADETGFSKADVKKFFAALENLVVKHLGKKGSRIITLPGVAKLTATPKAAIKGASRSQPLHRGDRRVQGQAGHGQGHRALKAFIKKIR